MTLGFVGLGAMGLPMATNLVRAGVEVHAWNRSQPALDLAEARGIRIAQSLAWLGAHTTTVVTMLPNLPQVRDILPELLADSSTVDTVAAMGTVSPTAVKDLAGELASRGVTLADAPVSGGRKGAEDATLSIMVGADDATFARLNPYLATMGSTVRHVGPVGAGSLAKACNQLVVAATIAGLAEAVLLAERGGLNPETLLDLLGGGLASSEVLNQKRMQLITSDFRGTGPASYLAKDLGFVLDAAAAERIRLPVADAVAHQYATVVALGLGNFDNTVVLDLLRRVAAAENATGAPR